MGIDIGNKPSGSKVTLDQQMMLKSVLGISRMPSSFGNISAYFNPSYFFICDSLSFFKEGKIITTLAVNAHSASGEINLSNIPNLSYLDCSNNLLTSLKIRNSPILYLDANTNSLPQIIIDGILQDLDSYGLRSGYCNLNGGTNAAPSILGVKYKASLQQKGWSIGTN
jgi:Leucine-rich repeat (LRR) protein